MTSTANSSKEMLPWLSFKTPLASLIASLMRASWYSSDLSVAGRKSSKYAMACAKCHR